jgi:hypothetical protein
VWSSTGKVWDRWRGRTGERKRGKVVYRAQVNNLVSRVWYTICTCWQHNFQWIIIIIIIIIMWSREKLTKYWNVQDRRSTGSVTPRPVRQTTAVVGKQWVLDILSVGL